jgi:hypothetical protein
MSQTIKKKTVAEGGSKIQQRNAGRLLGVDQTTEDVSEKQEP